LAGRIQVFKVDKTVADQLHWNRWAIWRETVEVYDIGAAVVGVLGDVITGLYQLAKLVVTVVGDVIIFQIETVMTAAEFAAKLATGDFDGVKEDLRKIGVAVDDAFASFEAFTQKVEKGLSILNLIKSDAMTRGLLADYINTLYQSVKYRDSRVIGVKIVAAVGIEVLLAIATAGAGNLARRAGEVATSASKASKAATIGPFPVQAIDQMADLAKALDAPAMKTPEKPPMIVVPEGKPKAKADGPEVKPKPNQLEEQKVPCFKKNKKGTIDEYNTQLEDQKKGLNNMTAQEYLDGCSGILNLGRRVLRYILNVRYKS
jgi:hypothetical protein